MKSNRTVFPLSLLVCLAVMPGARTLAAGPFAYVANSGSDDLTVIDTSTLETDGRIPVGPQPIDVAVAPDGRLAYVTRGDRTLAVVDVVDRFLAFAVPLAPLSESPGRIVLEANGGAAYVVDSNSVLFVDLRTNGVTGIPVTRSAGLTDVALSEDGRRLALTNASTGTVSVVDINSRSVVQTVVVGKAPSALVTTPDGLTYVANRGSSTVSVLCLDPDLDFCSPPGVSTILVGREPVSIVSSRFASLVFVLARDEIDVVDTNRNQVIDRFPLPLERNYRDLALDAREEFLLVTSQPPAEEGTVTANGVAADVGLTHLVDASSGQQMIPLTVGEAPEGVAASEVDFPPSPTPVACESDNDCPLGQACVGSVCAAFTSTPTPSGTQTSTPTQGPEKSATPTGTSAGSATPTPTEAPPDLLACGAAVMKGESDTFRILAGANAAVAIDVFPLDGPRNLRIRLRRGTNLLRDNCTGRIEQSALAAGSYLSDVSDCGGGNTGRYLVTLAVPNDQPNNCGKRLPCNGAIAERLEDPGIVKSFTFRSRGNESVLLETESNLSDGGLLELRVFGPDGKFIQGDGDSCSGTREVETTKGGTYTVLVNTCSGEDTGRFSLRQTCSGCPGDCNENRTVTLDEVIKGVRIALGVGSIGTCALLDTNGNGSAEIDELIAAIHSSKNECPNRAGDNTEGGQH